MLMITQTDFRLKLTAMEMGLQQIATETEYGFGLT